VPPGEHGRAGQQVGENQDFGHCFFRLRTISKYSL
jgi:hypothetical protein